VYFTYGMHYCVNLVCQRPGEAGAVLLRAGRVVAGAELAASRRRLAAGSEADGAAARSLARGPARLCQALAIARSQNGADVCDQDGPLRVLAPAGFAGQDSDAISSGPRVGVRLGAEEPWRFWLTGETAVSPYRPYVPKRRSPTALSIVTSWPAGGRMQPWATSSTS
jgi:DNA-3-methyladenine glycosylase